MQNLMNSKQKYEYNKDMYLVFSAVIDEKDGKL